MLLWLVLGTFAKSISFFFFFSFFESQTVPPSVLSLIYQSIEPVPDQSAPYFLFWLISVEVITPAGVFGRDARPKNLK